MYPVDRSYPRIGRLLLASSCVLAIGLFSTGCHHSDPAAIAPPPGLSTPPGTAQAPGGMAQAPGSPSYAPPMSGNVAAQPPQNGGYAPPPPSQGVASAPMAQGGAARYTPPPAGTGYTAQPQSSGYASGQTSANARQQANPYALSPQQLAEKRAIDTAPQPEHPNYIPPPYKQDPSELP